MTNPDMWIMKITPGDSPNTKMYFENLFINAGCKSVIGYSKDQGDIEKFRNRWNKMKIGDLIVVIAGYNKVFGVVEIASDPFDDENEEGDEKSDWFYHRRKAILIKYFNPSFEAKSDTNRDTIIEYSGDGAKAICDEVWIKIKDKYFHNKYKIELNTVIDLLKYKKQIILQGPPGTGKTKMAKEIAELMIGSSSTTNIKPSEINSNTIIDVLKNVSKISTPAGNAEYQIVSVDSVNEKVTLKRSTDTEGTTTFKSIKTSYKENQWENKLDNNEDRRSAAIAKYIFDNLKSTITEDQSEQLRLIQFHPSYSYEDFVRGIVAKPNEEGAGIVYEAENKLLGEFSRNAYINYRESKNKDDDQFKISWIDSIFEEFVSFIENNLIENNHRIPLTAKLGITNVKKDAFRISSDGWQGEDLKYSQIKKLFRYDIQQKSQLTKFPDIAKTVYHRTSYYFPVVELFKKYLVNQPKPADTVRIALKNYVLIIDEINRSNLSSVLGELIYAMEYRGKRVASMYEVDGSTDLILPPNFYIIGTMNTADRSVGRIDYAIRRRFAFVDVIPKDLSSEPNVVFNKLLFDKIGLLFDTNISPEFEKKEVQLGHSYFIEKSAEGGSMSIRLQYEIKPILLEYVKDGILVGENIKETIENLQA